MSYNFKNLVFEGGGAKGIAYIGVLEVLEEKGILENIIRAGGASAGSINALLLGLGYSVKEIREITKKGLDFEKILDDEWGFIRDTHRLITQYGWHKGEYLKKWISKLIKYKTGKDDITFEEHEHMQIGPQLHFVGTNLSTGFSNIFSCKTTPEMSISDAVRISMSIPLIFTAVKLDEEDCPHKNIYVDGGVLNNYPIRLFDSIEYVDEDYYIPLHYEKINLEEGKTAINYVCNKETLGFRLDSKDKIDVYMRNKNPRYRKIKNFFSYTYALINTIIEGQQDHHLNSSDWKRTIYIDTLGVKTIDFNISEEKKEELIKSGRDSTELYLSQYTSLKG
ncbi:patatin-like phospholipase family protein [Wukongibacter baidiensis]|uniref:patatin-like phospholipase family protein n=1 Tax=Wukongibacter baidiensis TaxID=1723361 RepID=UPI003D7F8656